MSGLDNMSQTKHPYATDLGLNPKRMSVSEQLAEVAKILAVGLLRLRARKEGKISRNLGQKREVSTGLCLPTERASDGELNPRSSE